MKRDKESLGRQEWWVVVKQGPILKQATPGLVRSGQVLTRCRGAPAWAPRPCLLTYSYLFKRVSTKGYADLLRLVLERGYTNEWHGQYYCTGAIVAHVVSNAPKDGLREELSALFGCSPTPWG